MHNRSTPTSASAWLLAALFTSSSLLACQSTPKERLEGRWVGSHVENFHPSQQPQAEGWAKGTSFEFKGSRVTVSIPAESARRGTYKLMALSDSDLRVTFMRPHGGADQAEFQLEGEDTLRWKLGDGRSVMMRKVID